MMTVPSRPSISAHAVLPPYSTVSGPALAIEPRVPHKQTLTLDRPWRRDAASRLLPALPEHGDATDEVAAAAEQREGSHLDLVVSTV
jgi:hypothetical protein